MLSIIKNVFYYIYKSMIIDAYSIFFWNAKYNNFVWLKSNNVVILRIFLLYTHFYTFLKFPNLNNKCYLIFKNLEINKINFNTEWFKYL